MKTLVFAFLLLGVGTAGAEMFFDKEAYVPVCWEKAPGQPYYHPCASDVLIENGYIEKRHIAWLERAQEVSKDPCLAKMEQAMKAMEPFLHNLYAQRYNYDEMGAKYQSMIVRADRVWNEARECWKEKP